MTAELAARAVEAMGRIAFALAIAFIAWLVLCQTPTCPSCGNPLDRPQTSTPAKLLGEK